MPKKVSRSVTADELMAKLNDVAENRKAAAKPFELKTIGVTLLVAPPAGADYYKRAVEIGFGSGPMAEIDDTFIRTLVKASVIEPELSDEAIDGIIANSVTDFQALSVFCIQMSQDLGRVDTGAAESFFSAEDGSTST